MSAPELFDRCLLRMRHKRAAASGGKNILIGRVAEDLGDRLGLVLRHFPVAVDLGSPESAALQALAELPTVGDVLRIAPSQDCGGAGTPMLVAEDEALPLAPASVNLAVSLLSLQWVNDLPGALLQIRRALEPDGLFMAALLGGETLTELRQSLFAAEAELLGGASPRVAPFADIRDLGALLQRAGFALPVADMDRICVRYGDPLRLLADLRAAGWTNALHERSRRPLTRTLLMRAMAIYRERFADADGRVPATFDVVWLSGWAPHESQQQPLQRGSARTSLAEALRAIEKAGGQGA